MKKFPALLLLLQLVRFSSFSPRNPQQRVRNLDILLLRQGLSLRSPSTTLTCLRQRRPLSRSHYARHGNYRQYHRYQEMTLNLDIALTEGSAEDEDEERKSSTKNNKDTTRKTSTYDLGVGKNLPVGYNDDNDALNSSDTIDIDHNNIHWNVPEYPNRKKIDDIESLTKSISSRYTASSNEPRRVRRMVARTEESNSLRGAIWDEEHYSFDDGMERKENSSSPLLEGTATGGTTATPFVVSSSSSTATNTTISEDSEREGPIAKPEQFYPNIDLSIPSTVYDPETSKDVVWDLMRWEAYQEAQREPLLVSFLYSSILNHDSLESSLAFLLANKLSSAAMISTQIQSLILNALYKDRSIGRSIRADIMAVRDRDPACLCLPDVFLYFKGFHALQTYRVAHAIWKTDNKQVLAHYLQSQMSQTFQIDIHPNATLGSGIMLDHGTGIVIGETAHLGHNCSILHHVTLGGSGKKGVDRHPKVGDGVLLGAGTSVLGNVNIGEGCQVGAGGLVITDLPPHSVAVGVPVKIIGSFVDVTEQPSISMNQTFLSEGI